MVSRMPLRCARGQVKAISRNRTDCIIAPETERGRTRLGDADKAPASDFAPVPDAKPQSFALAEMVTCDACLRANPPTRSNCLYCGAILPGTLKETQSTRESVGEPGTDANSNSGFCIVL